MPERPENVDEAFARLVAGFDTAPAQQDGRRPWPEAEDVTDDQPSPPPVDEPPADPPPPPVVAHPLPAGELNSEATWEDEGHFVPPTPPPLPRPAPLRLAAWLAVLVGPVVMTVVAALGWDVPDIVTAVLVVGFVGGVVYLIATMADGPRDPYGPDDGAVV